MKKIFVAGCIVALCLQEVCQAQGDKMIPITSSSPKAVTLYNEAVNALQDVYVARFDELIKKAIKEDPDFFMANYLLAMVSLNFYNDDAQFLKYAENAINSKAKLNSGEALIRQILEKMQKDRNADIRGLCEKIIDQYPKDINGYYELVGYYGRIKDTENQIKILKTAAANVGYPAPVYNQLGYLYLNLNKIDKTAAAFDKYIELAPRTPNPYDSKGDFYMAVKDYKKAYEYYMKANKIDTSWSYKKAQEAKAKSDSIAR